MTLCAIVCVCVCVSDWEALNIHMHAGYGARINNLHDKSTKTITDRTYAQIRNPQIRTESYRSLSDWMLVHIPLLCADHSFTGIYEQIRNPYINTESYRSLREWVLVHVRLLCASFIYMLYE